MFRPISTCRRQLLSFQSSRPSIRHVKIRRTVAGNQNYEPPSHASTVDGHSANTSSKKPPAKRSQLREQRETFEESTETTEHSHRDEWRPRESDLKPEVHVYRRSRSLRLNRSEEEVEPEEELGVYRPLNFSPEPVDRPRRASRHEEEYEEDIPWDSRREGEYEEEAHYRPFNSAQEERRSERPSRSYREEERRPRRSFQREGDEEKSDYRESDFSQEQERWPERPSYPRYEKEHRPQRSSRSAEEQELRHEEAHEGRRLSPRQLARQEKNRREPRGENEKHRYNYERQDKPHESNSHPRSYDPRSASGIQNPSFPKIYRPGTPFSHAVSTTNTRAVVVVVGGTCTREKKTGMQMGIGCYFGPESPHNIRQRLGMLFDKQRKNDQRAEVGSALAALKVLATELGEDVTVGEIIIVTNSIFLHRAMTESVQEWRAAGWTDSKGDTVANNDLIDELDGVMVGLEKEGVEVKLWLVNRQFTNVANALARQACKLPLREKDKVTALKFGKRGGVAEVEVKKEAKKAEAAKKAEVAKKAEAAGNIGFWGWGGAAAVVVSIPALMVLEWPFM